MTHLTAALRLRWGPPAIRPIAWRQLSCSSPEWDRRNSVILGSWEMGKNHPYSSSSPRFFIYKPKRGAGLEALNYFSFSGCQRCRGWFSPDSQHCQSFILCNKTSDCCSPSVMNSSLNREVHDTSSIPCLPWHSWLQSPALFTPCRNGGLVCAMLRSICLQILDYNLHF